MKKKVYLLALPVVAMVMSGCGKSKSLTADNFKVTPTPLEVSGGQVPATINVTVPAKFMKRKATVKCTPVLRWNGRQMVGNSFQFQGESVMGNNQIISYRSGGLATMRTAFPFESGMEKSDLYMEMTSTKGNKTKSLPAVKIGYGVVCTANLLAKTVTSSENAIAPDNFQRAISQKQTATIKFLIAQANLRGSELNNQTVKDFISTLRKIKNDEQSLVLNNVEVSAYASPDGTYGFNEQLANRREQNATQYVKSQLKNNGIETFVDSKYTAEDWEGFQELVSQSNIQDKDLILRVLSMYKDPEQREQEIKNISSVYGELATAVLPELRRARMVVNYEVIGRTDEQIKETYSTTPGLLNVEEMLYYANTLVDDVNEKENVYKKVTQIYPEDYRAYNNLGELAMRKGDYGLAESYLNKALSISNNAAEPNVNLGTIQLINGNYKAANEYIAKGTGANNLNEATGNLYIAQGQYSKACQALKGINNNSALLAQIMSKDYASAATTLAGMKQTDSTTDYLKAILAARQNNTSVLTNSLRDAISKDASWSQRALNDIEFANYEDIVKSVIK